MVAIRLREVRKRRGVTQEALAAKSGISRPTISKLEQGSDRVSTSLNTLLKIADALGVTFSDLFFDQDA